MAPHDTAIRTETRRLPAALGAPEPALPPFDPARHDLMPKVYLNPMGQFHVTPEDED